MRFVSSAQRKAVMAYYHGRTRFHHATLKFWSATTNTAERLPAVPRKDLVRTAKPTVPLQVLIRTKPHHEPASHILVKEQWVKKLPFGLKMQRHGRFNKHLKGLIKLNPRTSTAMMAHEYGHLRVQGSSWVRSEKRSRTPSGILNEEWRASKAGAKLYKKAGGSKLRYWAEMYPAYRTYKSSLANRKYARKIWPERKIGWE